MRLMISSVGVLRRLFELQRELGWTTGPTDPGLRRRALERLHKEYPTDQDVIRLLAESA